MVKLALTASQAFPRSTCTAKICPKGTSCVAATDIQTGITATRCEPAAEKTGHCPEPGPSNVGHCANFCRDDLDCNGDDKCCSNGCGFSCQPPMSAPSTTAPSITCANVKCGSNEECIMQPVQCIHHPCPDQPICVPIKTTTTTSSPVNPGVCPKSTLGGLGICAFTCDSDADCWKDQKCCHTACGGRSCVTVSSVHIPSCDFVKPCSCKNAEAKELLNCVQSCGPGEVCIMQRVQCFRRPCPTLPVCVTMEPPRCPPYPMWFDPRCLKYDLCSKQDPNSCNPDRFCCSTPCGRRCLTPRVW